MMLGIGAGFAPAARTDNPVYVYQGRMEPTDLVRTGDAGDKLEYLGGREFFAVSNDPAVVPVLPAAPVKVAPVQVIAAQPIPAAPPKQTQPAAVTPPADDKILGLDRATFYLVAAAGVGAALYMKGRQ